MPKGKRTKSSKNSRPKKRSRKTTKKKVKRTKRRKTSACAPCYPGAYYPSACPPSACYPSACYPSACYPSACYDPCGYYKPSGSSKKSSYGCYPSCGPCVYPVATSSGKIVAKERTSSDKFFPGCGMFCYNPRYSSCCSFPCGPC